MERTTHVDFQHLNVPLCAVDLEFVTPPSCSDQRRGLRGPLETIFERAPVNTSMGLRDDFQELWIDRGLSCECFADLHMHNVTEDLNSSTSRSARLRDWLAAEASAQAIVHYAEVEEAVSKWIESGAEVPSFLLDGTQEVVKPRWDDLRTSGTFNIIPGGLSPSTRSGFKSGESSPSFPPHLRDSDLQTTTLSSDGESSWDESVDDEWDSAGTSEIFTILAHLEQLRLAKREKRRALWLRREFESRWLAERTIEEFAALHMNSINGLPQRSRATRLREWYQSGSSALDNSKAVCAWVPQIEQAIVSWLLTKGGVLEEPNWDEEVEEENTLEPTYVGKASTPNSYTHKDESRIAALEAENEALNNRVQDLEKRCKETTSILAQNTSLKIELEKVREELEETRSERAQYVQARRQLIWAFEADKSQSPVEYAHSSLDRLVKELNDLPEGSRADRFAQWLQGELLKRFGGPVEDIAVCLIKEHTPTTTGTDMRPSVGGSKVLLLDGVDRDIITSLQLQVKELQTQLQNTNNLLNECKSENTCLSLEVERLVMHNNESENQEREKETKMHSEVLRESVNQQWLSQHTIEDFIKTYMREVICIPQRSQIARFRQWLQGDSAFGWEEAIEKCVEAWLNDATYPNTQKDEDVNQPEENKLLLGETDLQPEVNQAETSDRFTAEIEGRHSEADCFVHKYLAARGLRPIGTGEELAGDWIQKCEILSNTNRELEFYVSYLLGDQAVVQKEFTDLKYRYFQALGVSYKLQGMKLNFPLKDLYEVATTVTHNYTEYDAFLLSVLGT